MIIKQREDGYRGLLIGDQPGARGWAEQSEAENEGETHACRAVSAAQIKRAHLEDVNVVPRLRGDVGDATAIGSAQIS